MFRTKHQVFIDGESLDKSEEFSICGTFFFPIEVEGQMLYDITSSYEYFFIWKLTEPIVIRDLFTVLKKKKLGFRFLGD